MAFHLIPWRAVGRFVLTYFDAEQAFRSMLEGARELALKRGKESPVISRLGTVINQGIDTLDDFIPDLSFPQSEFARQFLLATWAEYKRTKGKDNPELVRFADQYGDDIAGVLANRVTMNDYDAIVSAVFDTLIERKAPELLSDLKNAIEVNDSPGTDSLESTES